MSRNVLSVALLLMVFMALVACRGREAIVEIPTPATLAATLPAATSTPVVNPAVSPTNTATATALPPAATATPTAIPPTATAIPPTATPVPPTATAVPPTATSIPNQGPPPGGSARIVFGPGATSATIQSTLAANGDTDTWVLRAVAGQIVTVQTISTAPGSINVMLGDMSGGVLATNPDSVGISAAVPATGDYQINFSTAAGAPQIGYTAQVFIPAAGGPVIPTRIQFAPGTSVAQLNDTLAAGGDLNQYVLRVAAGQAISVGVFASPPAVTNIFIRNNDGAIISSGTDMSGVGATAATAGDYFIDVSSAAAAPAVSYILTVNVPPLPSTDTQRIEFGPGQTSATVNGLLRAGLSARYVLRAQAGQTLVTDLTGHPANTVDIIIQDASGATLNFGKDPTSLGTAIPATGDVTITLSTTSATDVTYVMEVVIPPLPEADPTRIVFAPGATSATVFESLAFGGDVDTWVVRAAAGQVMSIGISTDQGGWMNLFVYNAAGQIIGFGSDSTGVAAPLANDGDYTILVSSIEAAPPLNYSMTVGIVDSGPSQPVRIEFGPGQTSAAFNGQVVAGGLPAQYVIRVGGGQTLLTNLNDNPPGNVDITITDAAGNLVNLGRAPTELGSKVATGGDYIITLSTGSANPVAYSLVVVVPPLPGAAETRILFSPGSTTATVSGELPTGGDSDTWVIGGAAGQVLNVYLGASQAGWIRAYVYNSAGDIIALGSDLDVIAAPLAAAGDYRVVVISDQAAGPISYSMVVEIP